MLPYAGAPIATLLFGVTVAGPAWAQTDPRIERLSRGIEIKNKLGTRINQRLSFVDHRGKRVKLGKYFGSKPVVLTLNYYKCTTLCSVQLTQFVRTMRKLKWTIGKKFRVVTISIDHREGWKLARGKRRSYLKTYGRGEVDWSFHVGSKKNIKRLADSIGFRYKFDSSHNQYVHVPAIFFLSPNGKLTRFLHGLRYPVRDIRFSLIDASKGKLGSVVEKFFMSCFHFDPNTGRYSAWAFGIMRILALGCAFILAVALIVLKVLERTRWTKAEAAAGDAVASTEPGEGKSES